MTPTRDGYVTCGTPRGELDHATLSEKRSGRTACGRRVYGRTSDPFRPERKWACQTCAKIVTKEQPGEEGSR